MELKRRWARPTDGRCGVRGRQTSCPSTSTIPPRCKFFPIASEGDSYKVRPL